MFHLINLRTHLYNCMRRQLLLTTNGSTRPSLVGSQTTACVPFRAEQASGQTRDECATNVANGVCMGREEDRTQCVSGCHHIILAVVESLPSPGDGATQSLRVSRETPSLFGECVGVSLAFTDPSCEGYFTYVTNTTKIPMKGANKPCIQGVPCTRAIKMTTLIRANSNAP